MTVFDNACLSLADDFAILGVDPVKAAAVFMLIWERATDHAEGQDEAAMALVSDFLGISER
jgi:hypothetical protein